MIPAIPAALLSSKKVWLALGVVVLVAGAVIYIMILRADLADARAEIAERNTQIVHLEAQITQRETSLNVLRADQQRASAAIHGLRGQASELQSALDRCSTARAQAEIIFQKAQEVPRETVVTSGGVIDSESSSAAVDLLNRVLCGGMQDNSAGTP